MGHLGIMSGSFLCNIGILFFCGGGGYLWEASYDPPCSETYPDGCPFGSYIMVPLNFSIDSFVTKSDKIMKIL